MARAFSVIALGLLFSLPSSLAIRTKVPADEPPATDSALTSSASVQRHSSSVGLVEANCGRLSVRGGLKVGETLKITANGWEDGNSDFVVEIATDNSQSMAQARDSPVEGGAGLAGGGSQGGDGAAGGAGDGGSIKEQPSIPIVGVRIPASTNEDGSSRQPSVLLYRRGESTPKELPLDSPAGPTSPFMVIFHQKSQAEMTVRLFTWVSSGSGAGGSWHEASMDVSVGLIHRDVLVATSDCKPQSLRLYGSASADLVTPGEDMCQAAEPQLLSLTASPPGGSQSVLEAPSDASEDV
ncbi:Microneme protein etmic-2/7h, related [Eimeria mitis]|uniref:Microneme protein etmic-2/7h, related n=1 Tax=Eimeria mitis TaxID=44415 RepID=U6KIH7_9EIME|nr:Microneme protein etmic-2/7h, related [Eimeria mitis]CDJ36057.1 Microneme protein etmic-2/7h, related [Eimeria mitis]